MKITPGKLAGMKAVSDDARRDCRRGDGSARIAAEGARQGEAARDVGDSEMEEFKTLVTEVLTPHASAILLDPEWGIPASKRRAKDAGLLLAYEKTGYDATTPGPAARPARRLVGAPPEGSRRRLHQDPALLHARRSARRSTTTSTRGSSASATSAAPTTSRSSSSSSATRKGVDEKGLEFAKKKPEIVDRQHGGVHQGSLRRGRAEGRSADQHEVRRGHAGVRRHEGATRKQEAMDAFRRAAEVATKPFIYLSAGVSNAEFTEALELAAEAGTRFSGVLCGRATWKDGISDLRASRARTRSASGCEDEGVKNIENVNDRAQAGAPVVRVLRREVGRRARARSSARVDAPGRLTGRVAAPVTSIPLQDSRRR